VMSLGLTASHVLGWRSGGSVGCWSVAGCGSAGKNHCLKRVAFPSRSVTSWSLASRRAG
jgi:hypothetical protein